MFKLLDKMESGDELTVETAYTSILERLALVIIEAHEDGDYELSGVEAQRYANLADVYSKNCADETKARFIANQWPDHFEFVAAKETYFTFQFNHKDGAVRGIMWESDENDTKSIIDIAEDPSYAVVKSHLINLYGNLRIRERDE